MEDRKNRLDKLQVLSLFLYFFLSFPSCFFVVVVIVLVIFFHLILFIISSAFCSFLFVFLFGSFSSFLFFLLLFSTGSTQSRQSLGAWLMSKCRIRLFYIYVHVFVCCRAPPITFIHMCVLSS